jgi:hypothetical protein
MDREILDGLNPTVGKTAIPIRDALVKAGWTFGRIQYDSSGVDPKLAFSGKSPGGTLVYVGCCESDLARKLQALWDLVSK